ncbi:acyl-CoA thioesterase [Paracraurococcus lichenis]|uniref:Thioesterase family protein n=1 Tax=Paracraurococcus lichenis TaxID=3064888 RepID=A0ABT9E2G8_9PROT|nr:thioesterase family protein [Paracraurococcus sp. LOR1-02]MDO9710344.1 thioesterase family protein [Paracraurococcus sp. LOR1-02]
MAPPPPAAARFPFWTEEKLRIADTDQNGHINNGAIGVFCEAGRAEVMHEVAGPPEARPVRMAVARVEIDYLREIHYPGRVRIGTAVARIGRTSITVEQGLYLDGACFATSRAVMVMLDRETRQPTELPEALLAGFTALAPREG